MSISKDSRIAIIGAGPAGLAAGMYLEQAGFHDYTILERTDHVGGKCHSPNYHGRRYEMGAIMGVPSYDTIQEIMDRTGDKVDGPKLRREFLHEDGEIYVPEKDPVRGPQVMAAVQKLGQLLATKYQGYDANGHYNKVHEDLMLPFDEFLALNGCEAARDLWINPFTAFGYGHFDNVPAAYVLKYLDFVTMMSFAKGDLWTWADGTQAMFEHLNATLEHPAERNVDITRITREDGKVHIHTTDWDRESDVLVLTVPLEKFLDYSDADDDEREYFSKIIHQQYMVDACLVKEYPTISGYVPDNMRPERLCTSWFTTTAGLMIRTRSSRPTCYVTIRTTRTRLRRSAARWSSTTWRPSVIRSRRSSRSRPGTTSRTLARRTTRPGGTRRSRECRVVATPSTPEKL